MHNITHVSLLLKVHGESSSIRPPRKSFDMRSPLPNIVTEVTLCVPHVDKPFRHATFDRNVIKVKQSTVWISGGVHAVQKTCELERRADTTAALKVSG